MGLWDKLFGGADPTSQWHAQSDLVIELNLSRPSICGIQLGDPVDRIAAIGRPDNTHPTQNELYVYSRHGFWIEADNGVVSSFSAVFDPNTAGMESNAFHGTVIHMNEKASLRASTTEAEFRRRFGNPYWRDTDDTEQLLFYEFGDIEWQVEFGRDGRLGALIIMTPPLMSDPGQRASYGVDKAWPPA